MDAITALHNRVSFAKLKAPAPSGTVLENIYKSAFRSCDHAKLRPWRFLTVEGEARQALGDLFVQALLHDKPTASEEQIERSRQLSLRAPLIVIACCIVQEHPKVPTIEQQLATGNAAQNMLLATYAQGFGGIWRTGNMAFHPVVKNGLGLLEKDHIIGFLYLGTPDIPAKTITKISTSDYFISWPNNK